MLRIIYTKMDEWSYHAHNIIYDVSSLCINGTRPNGKPGSNYIHWYINIFDIQR